MDDSLQDLHNAPINVNFELGVGGGGELGKGWGFDFKAFFLVKCPRDVIFGGKRTINFPPLQFR